MSRCGCGGTCSCALVAGSGTTVSGSGTPANPWKVNTLFEDCGDVRACITANQGAAFNQATGVISVCVSPNAGNALTRDANGCLFVGAGASTIAVGCGLNGTGAPASPVVIDTATWPYACNEGNGQHVYCDPVSGRIVTDPPVRQASFQESENVALPGAGTLVPTVTESNVRSLTLDITNPDPCRPAQVMFYRDVDVDLDLPPNSGAMVGIDGDDMSYLGNEGSSTIFSTHVQTSKMTVLTLAAGASQTITMNYTAGRGSGGARIRRFQGAMRAWVYSMP